MVSLVKWLFSKSSSNFITYKTLRKLNTKRKPLCNINYFINYFIQYLISKGAKINKSSTDGSTPLRHAHSLETIKYLLECGADINKTCNQGISLLIGVAGSFLLQKDAQIEILRYLLDKNTNFYQRTKNGYTALHIASFSSFAYKEVVQFLLDNGAPPMFTATSCVTDIDYIPSPVYLAAASTGNVDIVDVFLQREDCPIECIVDVYLLTALGRLGLAIYLFHIEEEIIRFYHVWIKGLEIMKEYIVQLSYPLPVDEYDLCKEAKTKEELYAYGVILWKCFSNMHCFMNDV